MLSPESKGNFGSTIMADTSNIFMKRKDENKQKEAGFGPYFSKIVFNKAAASTVADVSFKTELPKSFLVDDQNH